LLDFASSAKYHSPSYLYSKTRIAEGTFPADAGACIADEFETLMNYGVCPESVMPYTGNPTDAPTPLADVAAQPHRLPVAQQVELSQIAIQSVLASKQATVIGIQVYASLEQDTPDSGVIPMPNTATEQLKGGHAITIVGYTPDFMIVRNSWGTVWGEAGYGYLPWPYLKGGLTMEAWTGG
jgi:C1A family cysteine protease